ncbi:MAG TPA: UDP-N-acetylmuramate dehydrogenase [Gammaproteobacteria bacterium]|nr:UDP-N-acetylmuramate dehydrogenase [Gammaproteobacteria bacterium]
MTKFAGLRGLLQVDEPMSRHCSWRAGGLAALYFQPADRADVSHFLQQIDPQMPVYWVGLGSNLLVRDGGFDGAVINTRRLNSIVQSGSEQVLVEAGVSAAKVARFTADRALGGVEFLAGIPGTMGGALAMNAGAFGAETWSFVEVVETVGSDGHCHWRMTEEFSIGYRSVQGLPGEGFLQARLRLQPSTTDACRERIRALLADRAGSQPIQQACAGSVFRNPQGDYAGRLIEAAGLKGQRCGGATVSPRHANFIVNDHQASAADIETLITQVADTVAEHFGIRLQAEVKIIGGASS